MKKISLYCQVGKSLDMAQFSIQSAFANLGMSREDVEIIFICWKTSPEVYTWLKINKFKYVDMQYDEGKGFLWNLYKGWNLGYTEGFKYADYVCPIATDHAFYDNWLANMYKHAASNRIVNCKLIEPGVIPTLHDSINLGPTTFDGFNFDLFQQTCAYLEYIGRDLLMHETLLEPYHLNGGVGGTYGHRLDAMPFLCPRDVWEKFGPMNPELNAFGITGDTDFFDRCKAGGVDVTKALDAISYHCGGAETARNNAEGVYT
jgi:GT2 family glycosyltransferase